MNTHTLISEYRMGMWFAYCSCGHQYASSSDFDLIVQDHKGHLDHVAKADQQDPPTTQSH